MPEIKQWVVTSSGERPLQDVVEDLAAEGFDVDPEGILDAINSVVGQATDEVVNRVRAIPGVLEVSPPPYGEACVA